MNLTSEVVATNGYHFDNGHSVPERNNRKDNFNNPNVFVQGWAVAAKSREIKAGKVKSFPLFNRRIAIYRDHNDEVHALDARCPHLGADLGQGKVVEDGLQCAFHHWCFGPDGICRNAPGLAALPRHKARVYPVEERWGLVWIFNGPQPLFTLPAPVEKCRAWSLPSQHIQCHPHLVIANGLDASHFEALHDMVATAPPCLMVREPYEVCLELEGKPRPRYLQNLTGTRTQPIKASFTTLGSNLAWLEVQAPLRFYVLFSGRLSAAKGCDTQTVILLPVGVNFRAVQAFILLYILLRDDHRILNHLNFRAAFTENDLGLKSFVTLVNAMETW